jgi:amidase
MTFTLPNRERLQRLGATLGIDVDDAYAGQVLAALQPLVAEYRRVDLLPNEALPVKYPRAGAWRPEPAENRWSGWAVRTDIRGAAGGRLAGRRFAIKDNVMVAGVPMANGSSLLEGHVPEGDATIVTRILDAGGHIVGKSACEYFSFSGGSATSHTGRVESPRNPGHTPGGSSTGSAALLVAGDVDLAIGTDQAGSIRIPASFSGIVGHKPTYGLVPYTGVMGLDYTFDHVGPMARSVADVALLLEVIAGDDGIDGRQRYVRTQPYTEALAQGLDGLRIGVLAQGFGLPESHPGTDAAVRGAVGKLRAAGVAVEEVSIPCHLNGFAIWSALANEGTYHTLYGTRGAGHLHHGAYPLSLIGALGGLEARANEMPDTLKIGMLLGRYLHEQYQGHFYAKAQNQRRRLRAEYDAALARCDLLLLPTTPFPTTVIPPADASTEAVIQHSWTMLSNTCPFDVTGHPALSLPCGEADGKPVGLMLVGRHFDDATVLRAAAGFERL